jgi:hypothetical protein
MITIEHGSIRAAGYATAFALGLSLLAYLAGGAMFGFDTTYWAEWQGGIVGVAGTIAGVAGAVLGLRLALRAARR